MFSFLFCFFFSAPAGRFAPRVLFAFSIFDWPAQHHSASSTCVRPPRRASYLLRPSAASRVRERLVRPTTRKLQELHVVPDVPHDVEHVAVPDLTVHLLLDPREGHLRLESKEGAVPSARFHAAISRIGSPFFEISPNIPTVCAINSYSLSFALERRGARHLGVELFRPSLITLGPHLHLLLPLVCHRRRLAALIVEVSPLTLDGVRVQPIALIPGKPGRDQGCREAVPIQDSCACEILICIV